MSGWGWEATDRHGDGFEGADDYATFGEALADAGYELAVAGEVLDVWLVYTPPGGTYRQRRAVVRTNPGRRKGDPWTVVEWDDGYDPGTGERYPQPFDVHVVGDAEALCYPNHSVEPDGVCVEPACPNVGQSVPPF